MNYTELKKIGEDSNLNVIEAIKIILNETGELNKIALEAVCFLAVKAEGKCGTGAKPKTIWDRAKLFIDNKDAREYLRYCCVKDGCLYAGNGHIIMIEKTDMKYGTYHVNGEKYDGIISYPEGIDHKINNLMKGAVEMDIDDCEIVIKGKEKECIYGNMPCVFNKKYIDKLKKLGIKKLRMTQEICEGTYSSGAAYVTGIRR